MSERVNSGSGPSPLRDARTAIVVANELRHALISAIFGGSRREANFVTALAAGVALGGVASLFGRLGRLRIHHPSLGGAVLGSAIARESAHTVAGDFSRVTPLFSTLLILVALEKSFGPTLRAVRDSVRGVTGSLHRLRLWFDDVMDPRRDADATATDSRAGAV
jgi:hypothetical protein